MSEPALSYVTDSAGQTSRASNHVGCLPAPHTRTASDNDNALSVVVYHHVASCVDAFTDKLAVTTSPDTFRAHVRFFQRHYDLITPRDLEAGDLPRRPLLITFDDAYRSVCDVAAPILHEVGAEALFFINPAVVLDQRVPTDNLLAFAVTILGEEALAGLIGCTVRPVPSLPRLLMTFVARLSATELARTRQTVLDRLGYGDAELCARSGLFMQPDHLANLSAFGVHAANHTMTHRTLKYLSAEELDYEIRDAKTRIEAATGQTVRWLGLPYGSESDATPEALSVMAASGHAGAFLVQGRLNRFRPAPNIYYRVSPRNLRPSLLPVSLSLLPALRTLRHAARPRPLTPPG